MKYASKKKQATEKSICVSDISCVKIIYVQDQDEKRKLGKKVFFLILKIYFIA